jgi:prepilin-type processing-associated H-X9-DG protein
MKRYIVRHILMAMLAALALGALCFLQAPVRAQEMTGYTVIFPSVGLAPGQILRLTLFNPNGRPVRAQAYAHSGGANILLGDGSVRFLTAGVFQSFDFRRSDILLAGEEGTGRIQVRGSIRLTFSEAINPVVASMEIISISDGTSNTILIGEVIPSVPSSGGGNDVLIGGAARDILMGLVPGQTLRVTLFNPLSSGSVAGSVAGSEAQGEPISGHVKVFDGSGNLIAQSPEQVIPPGEFRSFDFNRNALPLRGEPGTNRAQARIKPFFKFESERLSPVLASFEIVDAGTGRTLGGAVAAVLYATLHNN